MYFILCPHQIHHWHIFLNLLWALCLQDHFSHEFTSLFPPVLGGFIKTPFAVLMWFFFHAVDSFLLSSHAFQTVLFKGIIVALPASFFESPFHNSLSAAAFWSRRAAFCFNTVDNMRWVSRIYVGFRRKPLEKELTSLALTDYLLHLCLEAHRGFQIMLRLTTIKYLFVSRIFQLGGWILRRSFQRGSKLEGCLRIEKSVTGWHSFRTKPQVTGSHTGQLFPFWGSCYIGRSRCDGWS